MTDLIRFLTFSAPCPNEVQPRHGIFVKSRLRQLLKDPMIEPHLPCLFSAYPNFGKCAAVLKKKFPCMIDVFHPRYPRIPKIAMSFALGLHTAAETVPAGFMQTYSTTMQGMK